MSVDAIIANAHAHERRMLEASREVLEDWGEDAAAHMRERRPWQDHTEHAKKGLNFVRVHPDELTEGGAVALVHGVDYGARLELDHGSTYSIIGPTVATEGPGLVADLKEVWK